MQRSLPLGAALTSAALLALSGCSSSDDDSGGGTVTLNTLSGLVRQTGGAPLPGVQIHAGTASATTDAVGAFILSSVGSFPTGTVLVEFDGSGIGAGNEFPVLEVLLELAPGQTSAVMPQVITLPDLTNPNSAMQTVNTDAMGATAAPIAATGPQANLSLAAPAGTVITVHGAPLVGPVNVQITPVPMEEVPMPLPGALAASSFVTIQPGAAAFDPPGAAQGLDVTLPNDAGFPVGMMVDIWSFDHDDGAWVNRSTETGEQGLVVDAGGGATEIQASGVITEGGWHAGVIPIDTSCATRVTGRVVAAGTANGVPGATIALSTGQFASADAAGIFEFVAVPAYDVGLLAGTPPVCQAVAFSYEVVLPPAFGSASSTVITVPGPSIVTGGETALGDIEVAVPNTGSLSGLVNGMPQAMGQAVMIEDAGGPVTSVVPGETGTFFISSLDAGAYTASYLFAGQPSPAEVPFTITAGELTSINIQGVMGGGTQTITVHVYRQIGDVNSPLEDVDGAAVTLVGTDPGSAGGLVGTTSSNGTVTFMDVTGPFDVTAQRDFVIQGFTTRAAQSVIGIEPTTSTINVLLPDLDLDIPVGDATVSGTVTNLPVLGANEEFEVRVASLGDGVLVNAARATVDGAGNYSAAVPSGTELHAVLALLETSSSEPQVMGTLLALDQGQLMSGGTLDLDFDWNDVSRVDWDQTVSFTSTGEASAMNDGGAAVSLIRGGSALEFDFGMSNEAPFQAFSYDLPDATDAGLGGLQLWVESAVENNLNGQEQSTSDRLAATPAAFTFEFITAPTLIQPAGGSTFTVAQMETLQVNWNPNNAASGGTNGLETFDITGFSGFGGQGVGPQGTFIIWSVFARQGTTLFTLPPVSLPMFEAGQSLSACIGKTRFEGAPLDFDALFSGNFEVDLPAFIGAIDRQREGEDCVDQVQVQ